MRTGLAFVALITLTSVAFAQAVPTVRLCDGTVPNCPLVGRNFPLATTANSEAAYSANATNLVPAGSATDVFCITGSATKTIKIQGIRISGTASANVVIDALMVKRSSANSGGTSSAVTAVPHESTQDAASASVIAYTANPTTGGLVGQLRSQKIVLSGSSAPNINIVPVVFQFPVYNGRVPTLIGVAQSVCVNLNGQTINTGALDIDAQWTEE